MLIAAQPLLYINSQRSNLSSYKINYTIQLQNFHVLISITCFSYFVIFHIQILKLTNLGFFGNRVVLNPGLGGMQLSLMNRLNQTESTVFKLRMLYFLRISSDYLGACGIFFYVDLLHNYDKCYNYILSKSENATLKFVFLGNLIDKDYKRCLRCISQNLANKWCKIHQFVSFDIRDASLWDLSFIQQI